MAGLSPVTWKAQVQFSNKVPASAFVPGDFYPGDIARVHGFSDITLPRESKTCAVWACMNLVRYCGVQKLK